ncbi:hypothetical protein C1645_811586 [Glomus cerebriforme]|uniref:Uncharacterized protein n=1 Tax=Glomus cerebriforme TaxID=658196 RepID=A0A397TSB2_9GLOM|nr:hypothetical protein C1645_811586 [Glomus cerebriforme]
MTYSQMRPQIYPYSRCQKSFPQKQPCSEQSEPVINKPKASEPSESIKPISEVVKIPSENIKPSSNEEASITFPTRAQHEEHLRKRTIKLMTVYKRLIREEIIQDKGVTSLWLVTNEEWKKNTTWASITQALDGWNKRDKGHQHLKDGYDFSKEEISVLVPSQRTG